MNIKDDVFNGWCACVRACVCVCVGMFIVVYEDTNLYNNMGMT